MRCEVCGSDGAKVREMVNGLFELCDTCHREGELIDDAQSMGREYTLNEWAKTAMCQNGNFKECPVCHESDNMEAGLANVCNVCRRATCCNATYDNLDEGVNLEDTLGFAEGTIDKFPKELRKHLHPGYRSFECLCICHDCAAELVKKLPQGRLAQMGDDSMWVASAKDAGIIKA